MAAPGSYSLKWHGHGLHLNASVSSLYKSEAFTDVILATSDGRYFSAHQFVLSSCSQYLQKMIMIGNSLKAISKVVVVLPPDIRHSTLNILLQYIYKGEAIVNHEQLPSIMKAAELLQISGLCLGKDKTPSIGDLLNNSNRSDNVLKQQNKNNSVEHKSLSTRETTKINHRILIPEVNFSEPDVVIVNEVNDSNSRSSTSTTSSNKKPNSSKNSPTPRKKIKENRNSSKDNKAETKSKKNIQEEVMEEVIVGEEVRIKEEPIDWEEQKTNDESDFFVKQEMVSEEEQETETEKCFVPLTCDLCQETFSTPALWVRHIRQLHPFTALASGRRNSQKEEPGGEYPPLHCELCQQVFTVPAEWVRHIQTHSEQQLAQENEVSTPDTSRGRVECTVCGKVLQSQASMQIHARTHTGERPYLCKICGREFNVKSNFLRHLRTLHNQLIDPSLVEAVTLT